MHGVLFINIPSRFSTLHLSPSVPVVAAPDPDPADDEVDPSSINPMLVDEVLHTIFDYLDFRSLKKCRQVCKTWTLLATKRVKLVLFGRYEEQQPEAMERLLNSFSMASFVNIEVRGNFGLPISTLLHANGPKLQRFVIHSGRQKVYCHLNNFKDLVLHAKIVISLLEDSQYKYFKFLDVYKRNPLWATVNKIVSDWESPYFPDFIELCPNLDSIIIPSHKNYLQGMRSIFACDRMIKLSADNMLGTLKSINFHVFKNETEYLRKFNALTWNLTKFEITIDSLNAVHLVRNCISQLSNLEILIVQVASLFDEYHRALMNSSNDNWLLPTGSRNLKHLTVASVGNKRILTRSIITLLHYYSLRTLSLKGFVGTNGFDELGGHDIQLQLSRLKTLEICGRKEPFLDISFFLRQIHPWPHVRELKLIQPRMQLLFAIFRTMPNIQFLELLLDTCLGGRAVPWNSVLGNAPFEPENPYVLPPPVLPETLNNPRPCVKDLQGLRSLKIGFTLDEIDYDDWKLKDAFTTDILLEFKELQYFHISQHQFTNEAIEALRQRVRPFCNINVRPNPIIMETDELDISN